MVRPIKTAVFPVAGLGTRFLPATKAMPKEMLTVVDRPVVQLAVDEAREAGIEHFVFVTGRGKTAIEDHFDHSYELEKTLEERGKTAELDELRRWLQDVEAEERQAQTQIKRLEADLKEILPTLGYDFDLEDHREQNVVQLPKPGK